MSKSNQAGKGDKYRPVDKAKYDANYDAIFRKKKKKTSVKNSLPEGV
jgi:hypothetical protein